MEGKKPKVNTTQDLLILDFREMIDGNFAMIINGDMIQKQVEKGLSVIDLNLTTKAKKFSPIVLIDMYKWKNVFRGGLPEIIAREISELENVVQKNMKKISDLENDLQSDKEVSELRQAIRERIIKFVRKYGFESLEVPIVRNYFRNLVLEARDKNSDKRKESKLRLRNLITAVSFTDKRTRINVDYDVSDFLWFYKEAEKKAKKFYKALARDCLYCSDRKNYSHCNSAIRETCSILLDYIKQKTFTEKEIKEFVKFDNKSDYLDHAIKTHFNCDSAMCEELKRYAKRMR